MTRPTKDDVERALALGVPSPYSADFAQHYAVLAAEVVSLREELAASQDTVAKAVAWLKELEEKLAAQTELVTLHKLDAAKLREELKDACSLVVARVDMVYPRYSSEAVDALLRAMDNDAFGFGHGVVADALEAVRASREPPLK